MEVAVGEYLCGAAVVRTEGQPSQCLNGMIVYRTLTFLSVVGNITRENMSTITACKASCGALLAVMQRVNYWDSRLWSIDDKWLSSCGLQLLRKLATRNLEDLVALIDL